MASGRGDSPLGGFDLLCLFVLRRIQLLLGDSSEPPRSTSDRDTRKTLRGKQGGDEHRDAVRLIVQSRGGARAEDRLTRAPTNTCLTSNQVVEQTKPRTREVSHVSRRRSIIDGEPGKVNDVVSASACRPGLIHFWNESLTVAALEFNRVIVAGGDPAPHP